MGYNRSGHRRKKRIQRSKREMDRLARKAASAPKTDEPKKDDSGN